jgi:hypothetical protein
MPVRCDDLADLLAASAGGPALADDRAREHAETCLRCQAELVRYRKLVRALQSLRAELVEPSPGLLGDVLDVLEAAGERHALRSLVRGRRVAFAGAGVAATLAGAGATYLLLSRRAQST